MNEREIIKNIIATEHTEMKPVEDEFVAIGRKMFSTIASEVQLGETVLVKNFGTFTLKKRKPRRRFDQGLKKVVETDPKQIIQFTQSPNVFRKNEEEE